MTLHPAQIGRYFEDFAIGDVYQHPLGRTINETDNTWFTLLTMNTNQNHFNAHFAQSHPITEGKIIVNSGFTVALVLGMSVTRLQPERDRQPGLDRHQAHAPGLRRRHPLLRVDRARHRESKSKPVRRASSRCAPAA